MTSSFKSQCGSLLAKVARWLGSEIIDQRTGQVIGRALLVPWRGKVLVLGLESHVQPVFLPEDKVRHGRQFIGFQSHPAPDFPHEPRS